jgi:hypothetical protein
MGRRYNGRRKVSKKDSTMQMKSLIFVVAASLSLASAAIAGADESGVTVAMKPLQAVSLDLGSRHVVTYFVTREGRCDLTVLTAARFEPNAVAAPGDVQRLRFRVDSSSSALLDSPQGGSLHFACAPDASALTLTRVDRVALQALTK